MAAGTLEFMSAIRTGPRAPGRARKPSVSVLRAAKSFEVLSVRVRSSGNSEATTPHNRMDSSDQTRSFRVLFRANTILQPLEQVIRLPRIRINGKNRDSNHLSSGIETDDCGCSGALSNLYYPKTNRGANPVFTNTASGLGGRIAGNLLREFSKRLTTNAPGERIP
jgi:hypothetical protein